MSGTNLTILLAFILGIARWLGLRSWGLPVLGLLAVAGFVLVARPEPSVLRAAAMGLVGLAGLATGTHRRGLPALAIAVIALVLLDPWLARAYGFALSVAATAGILVLGPPCIEALGRRLPGWLAAGIAVPLAAQLACLPIVVMLSGQISVVSVVTNLLAGPAVAPATVLGVAALLVAPVTTVGAQLLSWLAFPAVWWIVEVARHGADVPGATVAWQATPLSVAVLAAGCAVAALVAPAILRRRVLPLALAGALALWLIAPGRLPSAPRWVTAWPPPGWVLVACDVGQGDGLVLRAGPRAGVVVDTGPDPQLMDRCLRDLGIEQVPYVLLTHFHADHFGGLAGVLDGRSVSEIGVRPLATGAGAPRLRHAGVRLASGKVEPVRVGATRRAGAVTWTVLGPSELPFASPGARVLEDHEEGSENNASVVVLADVDGVRLLLTGDIEPDAQQALLRSGVDLRADVLKVPHHGSRYQDRDFLAAVDARLALISVGADNSYGHPSVSTLRQLSGVGTTVRRTDLGGAIAVVSDSSGLKVVRQKPP